MGLGRAVADAVAVATLVGAAALALPSAASKKARWAAARAGDADAAPDGAGAIDKGGMEAKANPIGTRVKSFPKGRETWLIPA
jgi:hypothetical protein